jgi:hypothetical protein
VYKKLVRCLTLILAIFLLGACGLLVGEPFIEAIPQADITQELNSRAIIDLRLYPDNNDAFTNFVIFYRIYTSDLYISSTGIRDTGLDEGTGTFVRINPTLDQNFRRINPLIDNEDRIGENMHNLFTSMNFHYLRFQHPYSLAIVPTPLGRSFFALPPEHRMIEFNFDSGAIPSMTVSPGAGPPYEAQFNLLRANTQGGIDFSLEPPDGRFLNSLALRDRAFIADTNINRDVVDFPNRVLDYTYAAIFIAAVGMSQTTFANVYSTPSMIHVFRLPDEP